MSIPVEPERLRAETDRYGRFPYVLTVTPDRCPQAVSAVVTWRGDTLTAEVGARTAANVAGRPEVSLLWPPPERGGYSLIVDGTAEVEDGALRLTPVTAVLHRPALLGVEAREGACSSDCETIL